IGEYSATTEAVISFAAGRTLSVPSSSGNTLQQLLGGVFAYGRLAFSLLFIGEYSATIPAQRRRGWAGSLSVPSSSGNTLQQGRRRRIFRARGGLSVPSSSGNTLQRELNGFDEKRCCCFQSPLHRGILCNGHRWPDHPRRH